MEWFSFQVARHSDTLASNVRNATTIMSSCAKDWPSFTCTTDYSYLSASIGSIFIARRAGK